MCILQLAQGMLAAKRCWSPSLMPGLWCSRQKAWRRFCFHLCYQFVAGLWGSVPQFPHPVTENWSFSEAGGNRCQIVLIKCFEKDKNFVATKCYDIEEAQLRPTMFDSYCDGIWVCGHQGTRTFWLAMSKSPFLLKIQAPILYGAPQNSRLWESPSYHRS